LGWPVPPTRGASRTVGASEPLATCASSCASAAARDPVSADLVKPSTVRAMLRGGPSRRQCVRPNRVHGHRGAPPRALGRAVRYWCTWAARQGKTLAPARGGSIMPRAADGIPRWVHPPLGLGFMRNLGFLDAIWNLQFPFFSMLLMHLIAWIWLQFCGIWLNSGLIWGTD